MTAARTVPPSAAPTVPQTLEEVALCDLAPEYFVEKYCRIKGADGKWEPFGLWPAQREVLRGWYGGQRHLCLKARQVGLSWLALAWALWRLLFRPGSVVLLLSLREEEAKELLERLRGMLTRLPEWMRVEMEDDRATCLRLTTGSVAHALPSHRGDSYTANFVLVDEASLIPDLGRLLGAVEPTVADSGQILLVSRANKRDPEGVFARLCRAALEGGGPWALAFLPWSARPGRDAAWYERQREASLALADNLDQLQEQYPASPEEALASATGDKRIPAAHLLACYAPRPLLPIPHALAHLHGLRLYELPQTGLQYRLGADPAEGLQSGDDSACAVVERLTGRQVAQWSGKHEPTLVFPKGLHDLARFFGAAPILVERNNHGHAVLGWLAQKGARVLQGPDGRLGLNKSPALKAQVWDGAAAEAALVHQAPPSTPFICDPLTYHQLASIERASLKAPEGLHDDEADAWALAQWARALSPPSVNVY